MQFYQEYHGTGSFTQRTFAPAGGSCELSVNTASGRFRADLEVCRELIESDEELLVLFPPPPITQEQLIKMLP